MEPASIFVWILIAFVVAYTFYEQVIKQPSGKRARDLLGRFKGDIKSTRYKNEAYADGKSPRRKAKKTR